MDKILVIIMCIVFFFVCLIASYFFVLSIFGIYFLVDWCKSKFFNYENFK